ncbi:5542_t:CDS:1, partial [Racocetra fulgida]
CLNIAYLNLYLTEKYQTINYIKFAEDFNFAPKKFHITAKTRSYNSEEPYLTISSDSRYNTK